MHGPLFLQVCSFPAIQGWIRGHPYKFAAMAAVIILVPLFYKIGLWTQLTGLIKNLLEKTPKDDTTIPLIPLSTTVPDIPLITGRGFNVGNDSFGKGW
jgi:hypothetical protein